MIMVSPFKISFRAYRSSNIVVFPLHFLRNNIDGNVEMIRLHRGLKKNLYQLASLEDENKKAVQVADTFGFFIKIFTCFLS